MVVRVRARGEDIRRFVLDNVEKRPQDIAALTAHHFSITRQAVNIHLKNLVSEGALSASGNTRNRVYKLCPLVEWKGHYGIEPGLAEDVAWNRDVIPILGKLPENVLDIWDYCFTEMFNNAIDHSQGKSIHLDITRTAANTQMLLMDNGIGVFKKIQEAMNLLDERHAILELCKGKLTTDPEKHTGQGIFFTSRLLDSFDILSGGVYFSHAFGNQEDWILERPEYRAGTSVYMKLTNHASRTCKKIFDQYSSEEDFGFIKTVVPVKLAQYGNEKLISRSQAKRVLARVDLFKTVLFDFEGVASIGQAFTDEIFRVFANAHLDIELVAIHANSDVKRTIQASKAERPVVAPTDLLRLEQS